MARPSMAPHLLTRPMAYANVEAEESDDDASVEKAELPFPWVLMDNDGLPYFWNEQTGESQWESPFVRANEDRDRDAVAGSEDDDNSSNSKSSSIVNKANRDVLPKEPYVLILKKKFACMPGDIFRAIGFTGRQSVLSVAIRGDCERRLPQGLEGIAWRWTTRPEDGSAEAIDSIWEECMSRRPKRARSNAERRENMLATPSVPNKKQRTSLEEGENRCILILISKFGLKEGMLVKVVGESKSKSSWTVVCMDSDGHKNGRHNLGKVLEGSAWKWSDPD